ncbi:MAG: HD domain-containing protein [Chloroflexi bacterium]|nr:HD domain-containing protein [Chloroflexota bacterium]
MPDLDSVRRWYPDRDAVHGFDHIQRVYRLAIVLAQAEGADVEIVAAAALLHDAENTSAAGRRKDHHHSSAELAAEALRAEGWDEPRIAAVQHCIRSHRFRDRREQPATLEAQVLFDADKLDAIGAVGAARAIGFAAQAGKPCYARPSAQFLESGATLPDEPHSAYHEYLYKLRKLKDQMYTPSARALAEERHRRLVTFFDWLALEVEESR